MVLCRLEAVARAASSSALRDRGFPPYNPHMQADKPYASRAGEKLAAAMDVFGVSADGRVCADLGSNVGGFVDCLLRRGATRVYAVDTGYGVLAYTLRKDPRVVVMERTNAMHVELPEPVELVTIDVAWTPQRRILPSARRLLGASGEAITLIKPHYEADRGRLQRGVLPTDELDAVLEHTLGEIRAAGFEILATTRSPIAGQGGNIEFLAHLRPIASSPAG
jgi:23S rRNA (cytidine1920-2'-O)/16S rRNA (cytidine1409-2'-O)-methyltransferase